LLASPHGETDEVAWRVTLLEDKLVIVCQVRDMDEVKLLGLVDNTAGGSRRRPEGGERDPNKIHS
jgi:hypothetical protein